jgi:uncharacterized protein YkwD
MQVAGLLSLIGKGKSLMIPDKVSRLAHLMLILALALGVLLQTRQSAEAGLWTPDANECAFLRDINAYRKAHGVGPLTLSRSLSMAADNHSRYMARTDDVDHTLGSVSWWQNILNYGYPEGLAMGENVLAGRQSAGGALKLWESSAPHNQNMLSRTWRAIGIARAVNTSGTYGYYWTTTFGSGSHRTIYCS